MLSKFILLFLVWIALTNSLDTQELIVGAVVSFIVVKLFTKDSDKIDLKVMLIKHLKFIPIFLKNLVKSNIDVARIVLSPKMPINTGIVKLSTSLTSNYDKLILANAITLTPGTITLELNNSDLFIHVLNIKDSNREVLQQEIIEEFEKSIR